jgi:hypothetical protein
MTDIDRRLAPHLLPGDLALDAVDGTGKLCTRNPAKLAALIRLCFLTYRP